MNLELSLTSGEALARGACEERASMETSRDLGEKMARKEQAGGEDRGEVTERDRCAEGTGNMNLRR